MALHSKQIFPAVIVKIEKPHSPSGVCQRHRPKPGWRAYIGECPVAVVLIESVPLIGQVGNNDVWPSVIVVVRKVDSHARVGTAVNIHGRTYAGMGVDFAD